MTYPPPPGPDGVHPPPPDPPIQAYQPPMQQPGYGYGSPYYQPAYQYPPQYAPPRPTEGLAIASLVVSCAGVLGLCAWTIGGVLGLVGAILGHVARRRIRRTGASGAGLALAGIIVGWVCTGIGLLGIAFLIAILVGDSNTY
jgi:hypothetical protein